MPLHPSIAGPSALIDSLLVHRDHQPNADSTSTCRAGWSPLADALSTTGSGGDGSSSGGSAEATSSSGTNEEWDASLLSALAVAPQPLFWVELPFPHPGTTLVEWVMHPAAAPGNLSRNQGAHTATNSSNNSSVGGSGGRGSGSSGGSASSNSGSPQLRSAWEVQHMARLILAILAAMHGAGHSHGALHPTAVEVWPYYE